MRWWKRITGMGKTPPNPSTNTNRATGFSAPDLPPLERAPDHSDTYHKLIGQVTAKNAVIQMMEREAASQTQRDLDWMLRGKRGPD